MPNPLLTSPSPPQVAEMKFPSEAVPSLLAALDAHTAWLRIEMERAVAHQEFLVLERTRLARATEREEQDFASAQEYRALAAEEARSGQTYRQALLQEMLRQNTALERIAEALSVRAGAATSAVDPAFEAFLSACGADMRSAVAARVEGAWLERLARDDSMYVRMAVARRAEGALLERLAGDASEHVRMAVAARKKELGVP